MQALPFHCPTLIRLSCSHRPQKRSAYSGNTAPASVNVSKSSGSNNCIIQSLCKQGKLKQAINLLSAVQEPTQRTYELALLACVSRNSLADARFIHYHLLSNGFERDSFLATKLINSYSALGSIEDARQVFEETPEKTAYVYAAIFRALTLAGEGVIVLELYRKMNQSRLPSDRFTFNYALKACVAANSSISLLNKGKEIHGRILREGCGKELHCMTTLVDVYAKFGSVSYARTVFQGMEVTSVVSWSAMIGCFVKNERPLEALELLKEMMSGAHAFPPNSVTMVSVLQACGALVALEQGKLLHAYVLRHGLDSILPVMNALITMYAKCGKLESGQRVFDNMKRRDAVSWNSLISSYGIHGFGQKAVDVFRRMKEVGVSPTLVSFVSVLGACSHAGLVKEAKQLFSLMQEEHAMRPSVEHYACMVDLLGRANKLEEAVKIIEDMRMEPGPKVWGSLLGSCRIHCNVELAERACRRLFELEPRNAGNYVLLSDIYATAGMWSEVKRIKKLLEQRGLQKVSGCSWTEIRREICTFVSVDEYNPRMQQLHALLMKLSKEMKENGYIPITKVVHYDLEDDEKERIMLGHNEKLALAYGLINSASGETIRISKNLRLCEDCHSFTKFVSKFTNRQILVRDVNRFHHFCDGICSCGDYW